ncbi:hypothetical protein M427DRAFT_154896 [Gonapodya prolifera JEL478]|uniref:RING-type domain-containing protein n=1 Tax=Gonapodya prolifera (strain JEL478) TaxID=1344416 RepID=A0A139AHA8_GONPJ|nr:hypothetical protein M427DRAFT_154896 [Gonapodya prolifera JEL478]|eukprot:KXS16202.1 hypothetical protein M427DRAFT_154896 [Gonapodya prolifera JEL478]
MRGLSTTGRGLPHSPISTRSRVPSNLPSGALSLFLLLLTLQALPCRAFTTPASALGTIRIPLDARSGGDAGDSSAGTGAASTSTDLPTMTTTSHATTRFTTSALFPSGNFNYSDAPTQDRLFFILAMMFFIAVIGIALIMTLVVTIRRFLHTLAIFAPLRTQNPALYRHLLWSGSTSITDLVARSEMVYHGPTVDLEQLAHMPVGRIGDAATGDQGLARPMSKLPGLRTLGSMVGSFVHFPSPRATPPFSTHTPAKRTPSHVSILTTLTSSSSAATLCPVCLDTLRTPGSVRTLPCGHVFHAACVDAWLVGWRGVCPVCRMDLTKGACAQNGQQAQNHEEETGTGTHGQSSEEERPSHTLGAPSSRYGSLIRIVTRFLRRRRAHRVTSDREPVTADLGLGLTGDSSSSTPPEDVAISITEAGTVAPRTPTQSTFSPSTSLEVIPGNSHFAAENIELSQIFAFSQSTNLPERDLGSQDT